MSEIDFEGTLVLEKMAEAGKLDEFFEAIDSDDFKKVISLMKSVRMDVETINIVLRQMSGGD